MIIKNAKIISWVLLILLCLLASAHLAHAADTVLEVGIPGVAGAEPGATAPTIVQYISFLYTFVLGFVGIAGFASIVFWGAVWTGSGVVDKKAAALDGIKNALYGIGIALTAFIILNTINPDLTVIKLPYITQINIKQKEIVPDLSGIALTEDGNLKREQLKVASHKQISFNKNECDPLCSKNCSCTSLRYLPKAAFDGLLMLAINVGTPDNPIVVTAGTENYISSATGKTIHQEHGRGKPVVDLRLVNGDRLDIFVQKNGTRLENTSGGEPIYELTLSGVRIKFTKEISSADPHWHVVFTAI